MQIASIDLIVPFAFSDPQCTDLRHTVVHGIIRNMDVVCLSLLA